MISKRKFFGIATACLLVVGLTVGGLVPLAVADASPSVSIDPADSGEVDPGGSFSVDVVVDSEALLVKACEVEVTFDTDLTATTAAGNPLLGSPVLAIPTDPAIAAGSVTWAVVRISDNAPAAVEGSFITIDFDVSAEAAGSYTLNIDATLLDENGDPIAVVENDGSVTVGPSPEEAPSVSIVPDSQTADAGGSFGVSVAVDSSGLLVKACEVEVTFDTDLTATTAAGNPLLGSPVLAIPTDPAIAAGEVTWAVVRISDNAPAAVEGNFITINFAVDAAAAGTYALAIDATLLDENGDLITIIENDGEVVVRIPDGVFEETFTGTLARGDRDRICTIPPGATNLEINLTATADLDLELYDMATLVVGYRGKISSKPGGPYEGDEFGYSGYSGGVEFITADSVSQAYDLKVYAYRAGSYTVTVSYVMPGPDTTPPTITIDVPAAASVRELLTITVSATDSSGVGVVYFMVLSEHWPPPPPPEPPEPEGSSSLAALQQDYEDMVAGLVSFSDEASVTFAPGWAGTYTVEAWAVDNVGNMSQETATFEVV